MCSQSQSWHRSWKGGLAGGGEEPAGQQVRQKAGGGAAHQLHPQKLAQVGQGPGLGQEDGHGLVAGGQEHGQQGAGGDEPAGVEVGRGHGEAALGHAAQQGSPQGAPGAQSGEGSGELVPGPVLQVFHEQVGPEEKGQGFQGVQQGIQQEIYHGTPPCER